MHLEIQQKSSNPFYRSVAYIITCLTDKRYTHKTQVSSNLKKQSIYYQDSSRPAGEAQRDGRFFLLTSPDSKNHKSPLRHGHQARKRKAYIRVLRINLQGKNFSGNKQKFAVLKCQIRSNIGSLIYTATEYHMLICLQVQKR